MSDGSGIDFGTIRSRPLSQQGRDNWDRAFGKLRDISVEDKLPHKQEVEGSIPSPAIFNPEDHEQLK